MENDSWQREDMFHILRGPGSIGSGCLFLEEDPVAPIAEAFAVEAFLRVPREDRAQFVFDVRILDHVLPDAVEARAGGIATQPDLIAARRLADKTDFGHVRSCAAVRATGRAND